MEERSKLMQLLSRARFVGRMALNIYLVLYWYYTGNIMQPSCKSMGTSLGSPTRNPQSNGKSPENFRKKVFHGKRGIPGEVLPLHKLNLR